MMPMLLAADKEVDFSIHHLIGYQFMGQTVYITTSHVCMLLIIVTIMIFAVVARKKIMHAEEVPTGLQNVVEFAVETLEGFVNSSMGTHGKKYICYVGTLFLYILLSNISGLFGLRPPTADYGVTLALGLITFTLITFNKFRYQKVSGVIKGLCDPWPIWAPINIIGDIAVPISLSLRLFANVLSGTVMMALIYGLLGFIATAWPAALHVYFDLFSGAIQTYVFSMLTMTYINNAIEG